MINSIYICTTINMLSLNQSLYRLRASEPKTIETIFKAKDIPEFFFLLFSIC